MRVSAYRLGLLIAVFGYGASETLAAECSPTIQVEGAWARATPPGAKVGAAYLQITGACGADALIGAESGVAGKVEIHNMFSEDGRMRMRAIPQLAVPANQRVTLQPGSFHIMLLDIRQPLREGERVELTLLFEKAGRIPVVAHVAALGAPAAPSMPAMPAGNGAR
jgi:periplasmic copper chaperone A